MVLLARLELCDFITGLKADGVESDPASSTTLMGRGRGRFAACESGLGLCPLRTIEEYSVGAR